MPAFILYFGKIDAAGSWYLPSIWASLWTSMSALAQALSAAMTGALADRIGRKWCGVMSGVISLAGAAVQYTAQTPSALLGGKIVVGLGIGITMATGTTYASEVVPPRLVPIIQKALVVFILIMQAVAMGVIRSFVPDVSEHAFRTVFAIQFAPAALVIVAYFLAPE
jgi:MFS family permease